MKPILAAWQKWLLAVAIPFILAALGLGGSLVVTKASHGTVSGVPEDIFKWLYAALAGAGLSLPAIFSYLKPLIVKWLPANDPKTDIILNSIDAAQIATYAALISRAQSPEEKAALTNAARLACDAFKEKLFPLGTVSGVVGSILLDPLNPPLHTPGFSPGARL